MSEPYLPCSCIEVINAKLAESNTIIAVPMFGPRLPFVATAKLDEKKRGSALKVFANHCPFCGQKARERPSIMPEIVI